jgi:DNA primase
MAEIDKQIQSRVPLRDLLQRDNVVLRRSGSRWAACCPLHQEKTPSFFVSTGRDGVERFKCFGCGKGGDVLDYWQLTRNTDLAGAREHLRNMSGIVWEGPVRKPQSLPQETAVELAPMNDRLKKVWDEGLIFLRESSSEQERIAEWRGWRASTVEKMVMLGVMGMPIYRGHRREAFSVLVPGGAVGGGQPFQAGFHVHTKELKGRFRFEPAGIGAWPFVIGEVESCSVLVILEGQWDAISFYDALTDGKEFPARVAVAGIRGASSWRKLLTWDWGQKVQVFLFADGDVAGQEWLADDSLAAALRLRCRAVHPFIWSADDDGVKDFNDFHKARAATSEEWHAMLRAWCEKGLQKRKRR